MFQSLENRRLCKKPRCPGQLPQLAARKMRTMEATSRALDHFLCAVGDPAADVLSIGPDDPEFDRAQTIRAAVGVLAKSPDALPALAKVLEAGAGAGAAPPTPPPPAPAPARVARRPRPAA